MLLRNIYQKSVCAGLFGLLGLLHGGEALAETLRTPEVQVTATRVEKELLEVPMAVSVITKEDIKKSSARTVGELLQDVPGVQVRNSGAQGIKRVSIRGENPNRVLILIDGQKIAENKSMEGAALLVDPASIERIEVIKGPASVLYGSEAMGGVINIITRKGGTKPLQGEAAVGFNSATRGFDESLSLFGSYKGFNYRASGTNSKQNALQTPEGRAEHSQFMQQSGSAFLSYDVSPNFTLGGNYEQFYSEVMAGDRTAENFFVNINPWSRQKAAAFAEAREVTSFIPRVRIDTFWQKSEKDMHNHVEAAAGSGSMLMDNYAKNYNDQLGATLQVDWQIGDNHYLITGYDVNKDGLDATTNTVVNVRPTAQMHVEQSSRYRYEGNMQTHALFGQMESKLPADFTLTYGVRQTWVKSSMDTATGYGTTRMSMGGRPLAVTSQGAIDAGIEDSSWESQPVFNTSLMWTGIKNLSLRTGFSQGFRVPSLQDKYVISSMGGGTILPNASLTPERSNTWEVGARYSLGGWSIDTTAFYSIAKDYIASQTIDQAANTMRYVNVNDAKTHGVELATSYDLPWGITPYASLTWMQREFDYGGWKTWRSGTPEWSGRGGLRSVYALSETVDLTGDVYARFASKSEEESGTKDARTRTVIDAWTTANAAVGLRFGAEKQYTLAAEVLNLFNQTYTLDGAILEPATHLNVKFSVAF